MKPLGDAASELPWLTPSAASLIALTQSEPGWQDVRSDPGALLLVLRVEGRSSACGTSSTTSALCAEVDVLRIALAMLALPAHRPVGWDQHGPNFVYRHCLEIASLATGLAKRLPRCDAERAWIAGLLAPLGWLAVCAAAPSRVSQTLGELAQPGAQNGWQQQAWGIDHAGLVRRLSRSWGLPAWLAAVIGHLGLPVDVALQLGAEPVLFQTVQLAVALRQRHNPGLALPIGSDIGGLLRSLDLSSAEAEKLVQTSRPTNADPAGQSRQLPTRRQMLRELICLALEGRIARSKQSAVVDGDKRLQTQKMAALAELAAGAGHEINNPLAVISGQAQYIARQLEQAQSLIPEEPALEEYLTTLQAGIQHSLATIRGQSQRIRQVLTSLMQFARPTPPRPGIVTVRELLREAAAAVHDLALIKKVRITCGEVSDSWRVRADRSQSVAALTCLLRNAVESAPADGWASVRAEQSGTTLCLQVEDNGPGPNSAALEHMFDPFYSGRSAGRGQGLGLPIAWRLAQQQGGDVRFDGHTGGVTRFVLNLPGLESGYRAPEANGQARVSAASGNGVKEYLTAAAGS